MAAWQEMEETFTVPVHGEDGPESPATAPAQFGSGPTALLSVSVSTRCQVIMLCMAATGTQLMMRSLPFITTVGKDGMAAQYGWDEEDVGNFYAAFGWGYALSQVPGSMAAQHYGHKRVWQVCLRARSYLPEAQSH